MTRPTSEIPVAAGVVPGTIELKVGPSPIVDVAERFVWTAVQAFVGSLPATLVLSGHNLAAVGYSGLTAAVAAVISLAKNLTRVSQ